MTEVVDFKFISKPNNSLPVASMARLVMFLAIVPIGIAIAFALAGIWMVLPFTLIELSALAYAFYFFSCHVDDYECISISDDRLVVERKSNRHVSKTEFNAYWPQVVLQDAPKGIKQLWLRSHGASVEIGRYMNNPQRINLAQQLKLRIGPTRIQDGT